MYRYKCVFIPTVGAPETPLDGGLVFCMDGAVELLTADVQSDADPSKRRQITLVKAVGHAGMQELGQLSTKLLGTANADPTRPVNCRGSLWYRDTEQNGGEEVVAELSARNTKLLNSLPAGVIGKSDIVLTITKVESLFNDTVRLIYTGTHDRYPAAIIAIRDVYNHTFHGFERLDVGNVILFTHHDENTMDATVLVPGLEQLAATIRRRQWYGPWVCATQSMRRRATRAYELGASYIAELLDGKRDTATAGIFSLTRPGRLTYADATIDVPPELFAGLIERIRNIQLHLHSTDAYNQPSSAYIRLTGIDADKLLLGAPRLDEDFNLTVLMAAEAGCNLAAIAVSGVSVRYERKITAGNATLHYVNGRKIAKDDVVHAILRVGCHADQGGYDDYLRAISAISRRFHLANTEGVPCTVVERSVQRAIDRGLGTVFSPDGHNRPAGDGLTVSVALKFRKANASERGRVFMLGKWREIADYDKLLNALDCCSKGPRPHTAHGLSGGSVALALQLLRVDDALTEDSRILADVLTRVDRHTVSLKAGHDPAEVSKIVGEFAEEFADQLAASSAKLERSYNLFLSVMDQCGGRQSVRHGATGYEVTGKSGIPYWINHLTGQVMRGDTGAHICIVNSGSTDHAGYDYLASLLAALRHDLRTAKDITTLQSHVNPAAT